MSSLSRTFARASRRGKKLMEQYQPAGAYASGEKAFKQAQEIKKRRRAALKAEPIIPVTAHAQQKKEHHDRQR